MCRYNIYICVCDLYMYIHLHFLKGENHTKKDDLDWRKKNVGFVPVQPNAFKVVEKQLL